MVKFIPKITNFGDFRGLHVSPHFKSDNGEIWREGTDMGHFSHAPNFVKNRSWGFVLYWKSFTKNSKFSRLLAT